MGHGILRPGQSGDAGILRRRVDAGVQIDRQLAGIVIKLARPDGIAQAPAGHGIGLGPAIEQDQPVADGRVIQQGDMLLPVIDELVVDLVAHHRHLRPGFHALDEGFDLGFGGDAAGGIGG